MIRQTRSFPRLVYSIFSGRKYVAFTLLFGIFLNAIPWQFNIGIPDFAGLILLFWNITQPHLIGLGVAFFFGLVVDTHSGTALGQTAFLYTLQAFVAIQIHQRVEWFGIGTQILFILPILLLVQVLGFGLNSIMGNSPSNPYFFAASIVGALLWPVIVALLTWPSRFHQRHRSH